MTMQIDHLSNPSSLVSWERERIASPVNAFVRFEREYTELSVPDCFEQRSLRYAERVAIETPEGGITYGELNSASDRLASILLRERGTGQEPIALLLEHDAPVPVAMMAVLKAGKFYVPLDPSYPVQRNREILKDSQTKLIITNNKNLALASEFSGDRHQMILLEEGARGNDLQRPRISVRKEDLAYVLYTSGSTGSPKGVMHTHGNLLHKVMRHTNGRRICSEDRLALLFSYSFGASLTNTFGALLNGSTLIPFNLRERGISQLAGWLRDQRITIVHTVPTVFRHFVHGLQSGETFPTLRLIRLGGETMYRSDVELFREHFGNDCILHLGMGSGETGVVLECFFDKHTECRTELAPAGYATEDTEVLIVDEAGQPVGFEHVGEIAIRGRFLSVGYWRKPDLTESSFLPDPTGGDCRTYLTGDLGYMLRDGCVFHLGRKDSQVKIRGARVELAEVEATFLSLPQVREAVVVAREDRTGEKRLAAYVVLQPDSGVTSQSLGRSVRAKLPDFMVPSLIELRDSLPLLPNGKVDRQALSKTPPTERRDRDTSLTPPRYFLEVQLGHIWEEVLELRSIGIRDDFFDLGGDSLRAVEMFSRVEEICGKRLSPSRLLSRLTIEQLAEVLLEDDSESFKGALVPIQVGGLNRPFFFLHGDCETGGFYCRNLSKHLGQDQPFYAVMPHGYDEQPIPEYVETMAQDRLRAILEIQPTGPYLLGGFCGGGIVAFEIAQQLRRNGQQVEPLLLIDSRAKNIELRSLHKVSRWLARAFRMTLTEERQCFRRLRWWHDGWRESAKRGVQGQTAFLVGKASHWTKASFRALASPFSRDSIAPEEQPLDTGFSDSLDERTLRYLRHHSAVSYYVPQRYPGRIVLFGSTTLRERCAGDLTAGWSEVTPDLEVHWIEGDHKSCVTKYAAEVAHKLRPYLFKRSAV
ncbi:MAG: amino acid adenylation domain-containing protein [Acidobacteriota bacterium]